MKGSIKASDDQSKYKDDGRHWILFKNVANLVVDGGGSGKVDGNGKFWWQNSCKVDESLQCKDAPTAMTFYGCNNLRVQNLKIQNAQQMHMSFEKCNNVNVSGIQVTAPADSPNTGTGIPKWNKRAKLIGTTNGVRIKTWQGGLGSASQISFKNIEMQSLSNPIIIDQNYCDKAQPCKNQKSAVQVKDVVYKNIRGTSATDVAVRFICSNSVPCWGITMQDVSLRAVDRSEVKASCSNVDVTDVGNVSPSCPS